MRRSRRWHLCRFGGWHPLAGTPAKTPAAIINRLNQEIARFLSLPDVKERFLNTGVEVVASTPEQFEAEMKSEMARMGKVIRDAGIRAE